jgi:16S rRNA (guanine966-N2)-methyltransferase
MSRTAGSALRIVGGALGGRRFGRPERVTRPTSDRVREALASILEARGAIEGAHVLELYAGTGASSFEMLSRGAADAVLVERDARAAKDLDESARELGLSDRTTRLRLDLESRGAIVRLPEGPFDLVLADPPYDAVSEAVAVLASLAETRRLAPGGLVVLEHRTKDVALVDRALEPVVTSSRLVSVSRYRYGDTTLSLLAIDDEAREATALDTPPTESEDA